MYFHYFEKSLKIKNFAVNRVTFKVKCQGVILQNKEKKKKGIFRLLSHKTQKCSIWSQSHENYTLFFTSTKRIFCGKVRLRLKLSLRSLCYDGPWVLERCTFSLSSGLSCPDSSLSIILSSLSCLYRLYSSSKSWVGAILFSVKIQTLKVKSSYKLTITTMIFNFF